MFTIDRADFDNMILAATNLVVEMTNIIKIEVLERAGNCFKPPLTNKVFSVFDCTFLQLKRSEYQRR